MRKFMTAAAAAMMISTIGVASAGAYARNTAPNLIGGPSCNLSNMTLTFAWDKNAGKPATYAYEYQYGSGTVTFNGKIPGGAGARGFLSVALSVTQPPADGVTVTIYAYNASGNDSIQTVCYYPF